MNKYWQYVMLPAGFTIVYNLGEGIISIFPGVQDETLTLFGFEVDSFIEVILVLGILAMVPRTRMHRDTPRSQFERTVLRVTGISFCLLAPKPGANSDLQYRDGTQSDDNDSGN